MDKSTKTGHRFGCPTAGEPMHQACWVQDDGSVGRRVDPSYGELRAEIERLREVEIKSLEAECVAHVETIERLRAALEWVRDNTELWDAPIVLEALDRNKCRSN